MIEDVSSEDDFSDSGGVFSEGIVIVVERWCWLWLSHSKHILSLIQKKRAPLHGLSLL
jgi:hypothetical protein